MSVYTLADKETVLSTLCEVNDVEYIGCEEGSELFQLITINLFMLGVSSWNLLTVSMIFLRIKHEFTV